MKFKDKLRAKRIKAGYSMTQMAKKLGVSVVSYSYYESGKRTPLLGRVKKMAKIFNTNLSDLVGDDNDF